MDALSIIDRGTQTVDTVAPEKTVKKNEQQFGKVLNEKQQTQQPRDSKPTDSQPEAATNPKIQQNIAHNHKAEAQQDKVGQEEALDGAIVESCIRAETIRQPQVKVQQALVDLMKTVAEDKSSAGAEGFDPIETLVTDLVQQLDLAELPGEQVLVGIDLSLLATELNSLNKDSDHEDLLAQLVTAIEAQLTDETGLPQNGELAATMVVTPQQQNVVPVVMENLAKARQILQKAFDSVVSQKPVAVENMVTEESVAVAEQPVEEITFAVEEASEQIDPRFAGLLKQRNGQHSVQQVHSGKEQTSLHHSRQQVEMTQGDPVVQTAATELSQKVEATQLSGEGSKQVFENLVQQTQHNLHAQGQPLVQGLGTNKAVPQTPVVQLASGQQVPESHIFDQVVTHLSGSVNGESGRMVLRLQPAELGSLKLELVVEGDRIRANLHAQSHQVQEVLERNLPQLRNALAEQGLKIDQFRVEVDQQQTKGQFENLAQQQQHNGSERQSEWQQRHLEPEEQNIPLAHLMQNGGGGISLHV